MSNYSAGHSAEKVAAKYLEAQGYKIRGLNWKTKYCEIDVVAEKAKRIFFVEVKYRKHLDWGGGLDYITAKKISQMRFAAEMWASNNKWTGDYQLAAIELSGQPPLVATFLADL
jgi:uncharacterized protein (TIGR00252 family)